MPNFNETSSHETFVVIDNTAFAMGFNINLLQDELDNLHLYTTGAIYSEASENAKSAQLLEIAHNQRILTIEDPTTEAMEKTKEIAEVTGDLGVLSMADQELIGLGLDLKNMHPDATVLIMSDDYAVQNVCTVLSLSIYSLFKDKIKKVIYWEVYCPRCFQTFPNSHLKSQCPECEANLKRRPKRK